MPIPILPALLTGLLTFNAAHYWHDQFKPFQNDDERVQAVKEVLAESSFTAFWNNEDKKALVQDEKFLKIERDCGRRSGAFSVTSGSYYNYNYKYTLIDPEFSLFHQGKNKHAIQKECDFYHFGLAHEGAHISQDLNLIFLSLNKGTPQERTKFLRFIEHDADQKALYAMLHHPELSSYKKIKAFVVYKSIFKTDCEMYHSAFLDKRMCEQEGSSHPPCKERIALMEQYIQNARIEAVHETVRDEIAWH